MQADAPIMVREGQKHFKIGTFLVKKTNKLTDI